MINSVTISTRVRFARNLSEFPFSEMMSPEQGEMIIQKVNLAIKKVKIGGGFALIRLSALTDIDCIALVENHLISPKLLENKATGALLLSKDQTISIMINEEDHIRIQVILQGQQTRLAYEMAVEIDKKLEVLGYSCNPKFGYLTSCPTNTGTGMRVSIMLHLPAIIRTGNLSKTMESCNKLGIAVRGMYGENSEALGHMIQISNQVTLGHTEEELVTTVERIANQIVDWELLLRKSMLKEDRMGIEDEVYRAFGVLANARRLKTKEALQLLSDLRTGVDMGLISSVTKEMLDELQIVVQPATIQKLAGRTLPPEERDIVRADVVRDRIEQKRRE